MKNSKTYIEERAVNVEKMEAIVELAKAEERELTTEEQTEFDSLNEIVEDLTAKAERASKFEEITINKAMKVERNENTPKELKNYSFQEAMRQAYTGKIEGMQGGSYLVGIKVGKKHKTLIVRSEHLRRVR